MIGACRDPKACSSLPKVQKGHGGSYGGGHNTGEIPTPYLQSAEGGHHLDMPECAGSSEQVLNKLVLYGNSSFIVVSSHALHIAYIDFGLRHLSFNHS